mgnify:CR=1 FL=1
MGDAAEPGIVLRIWGARGSTPAPGRDPARYGGETTPPVPYTHLTLPTISSV